MHDPGLVSGAIGDAFGVPDPFEPHPDVGIAEAADSVELVKTLDRASIRASTVCRFDVASMVDRYVSVYRSVLATDP